jgi:hypothetical protein
MKIRVERASVGSRRFQRMDLIVEVASCEFESLSDIVVLELGV